MEAKVSLGGGQLNICGSVDIEIPVRYVPAEIDKPEKDISSVYAPWQTGVDIWSRPTYHLCPISSRVHETALVSGVGEREKVGCSEIWVSCWYFQIGWEESPSSKKGLSLLILKGLLPFAELQSASVANCSCCRMALLTLGRGFVSVHIMLPTCLPQLGEAPKKLMWKEISTRRRQQQRKKKKAYTPDLSCLYLAHQYQFDYTSTLEKDLGYIWWTYQQWDNLTAEIIKHVHSKYGILFFSLSKNWL